MIKAIIIVVLCGSTSFVFCAAPRPVGRLELPCSFPTFEAWSDEQRVQNIPEELIIDAEYAQTLRKLVQGRYGDAHILRYGDFMDQWGGEESIHQMIKRGKTIRARAMQSPVEFYKHYLNQKSAELSQVDIFKDSEITIAQAHEMTEALPNLEDRVPLLRDEGAGTLFVTTLTGQRFFIGVGPATTLNDIKRRIHDKTGLPVAQQRIMSYGKLVKSAVDLGNIARGREKIHVMGARLK